MDKIIELCKLVYTITSAYNNDIVKRNTKSDLFDALAFDTLYTQSNKTQAAAAAALNFRKKKEDRLRRQNYIKRAKQIPEQMYIDINNRLDEFGNEKIDNSPQNFIKHKLAVDGSKINLNIKLQEEGYSLNPNELMTSGYILGIYDAAQQNPIAMKLYKSHNERQAVIDFLKDTEQYRDYVFIFDRGFYSSELERKLKQKGILYVFRMKANSKLIPESFHDNTKDRCDQIVKDKDNFERRIVKFTVNNKTFFLATALVDNTKYSIDILMQIYHDRWSVEEYFKFNKTSLKLDQIPLKSEAAVKRFINNLLFISKLIYLIQKILENDIRKRKSGYVDNNKVINRSLLAEGLFNESFLIDFIYNENFEKTLEAFIDTYVDVVNSQKGRSFPIQCINPNKKSYRKCSRTASKRKQSQESQNETPTT